MPGQEADDVFRLLADETRLDVLRTVARQQRDRRQTGVAGLSFSELYDRVDVDDTSKLSYHLGELTGTFLRKREDGYVFTHAGERLVRFVLAENYRAPPDFGTIDTEGTCLFCGESALRATYRDRYFTVVCGACDRPAFSYRVRPAQVRSRDPEDLIDAVVREQVGDLFKLRQGVCPECAGRLDTAVVDAETHPVPDEMPIDFATVSECTECLQCLGLPLTHAAAYHPASVAFHWVHGVDVLSSGPWAFHRHVADGRWRAERVDADEYRVEFRRDDASLRLFLDDAASVTRTERVRYSGGRDGQS
ncbi:ArsR/SmtB family transcription factor [Haloarcula litorea]|uniref:ArsR/SmtB family transcription factor n=1 Tax=Haloarcula litorea TaxID=3032579 RepID=UPI0023E768DF|nr:helix-turn-helix domain-containing protein [Halomicroarcula sp. GDY20]